MPALTGMSLISICRAQLNDLTWWPNADLLSFLDAAEKKFMALAPDDALNEVQAVTITNLSAVVSGEVAASISLPSNYYQFRLVQTRLVQADDFANADLIPVEDLFSQARVESAGKGRRGQPVVAVWGNKLYVFPGNTATVTNGLRMFYITNLAGITATASTPTINETHHPILPEYALYLAYQKIADVQRAQQHLQNFSSYIDTLYAEVLGRNKSTPPTVRQ